MFRFYPIRFRKSGRKGMTFLLVGKIYATIFLFFSIRKGYGFFKNCNYNESVFILIHPTH